MRAAGWLRLVQTPSGVVRRIKSIARWQVLLAALIAVGLAARCRQYLAAPSYWYDEAFLLTNVMDKSFGELIGPLTEHQVTPPLFLWLLRALYVTAGSGELIMRFPALAASMAALFLMIPLARRLLGGTAWIWPVALCAVSNHALAHAYQVKPYSSDLLVTLL